jgi:hypothetical protein
MLFDPVCSDPGMTIPTAPQQAIGKILSSLHGVEAKLSATFMGPILANSSRSPVFPQKIVSEVNYCELLFLELSKSREKPEILSSYNFKNK